MGKIKKILIVGLDRAGKTSIVNILHNKYEKMDNIKPTAGIEREEIEILGIQILTWDLGGQQVFRQGYLNDVKIFAETDSLFFVVDAVDARRYEEALQYYTGILDNFKKLDLKPKIILCVHKVDPNMRNNPNTKRIVEDLKNYFLKRSSGFEITTFITSIYDRKTIVEAFSKSLQESIVTLKSFKTLLAKIVSEFKLCGLILFDQGLLILSESYRDSECEEMCLNAAYNSVYYMSQTNPQMAEDIHFAKNFEFILNLRNQEKRFNFVPVSFKDWTLFLLTVGEEKLDTSVLAEKFNSTAREIVLS